MRSLERLTPATVDVLQTLLSSAEPMWGLRVVKATGRAAGVVYPILDRLESIEWLTSRWEETSARSGPRRRFYSFSDEGRAAAQDACALFISRQQAVPARRHVSLGPELA